MDITEDWLLEIGGWQVFKEARALWKTGVISVTESGDSDSLSGTLLVGGKVQKAMLIITSRTEVKGVCSCRDSRRGVLCRHVIGIGVAVAHGEVPEEKTGGVIPITLEKQKVFDIPKKRKNESQFAFRVLFAGNLNSSLGRGKLAVRLLECDEAPVDADQRLAEWLDANHEGAMPFMGSLVGDQTDEFLKIVGGHPRCVRALKGGGEEGIQISPIPIRLPVRVEKSQVDGFSRIRLRCSVADPLVGMYSISGTRLFPLAKPPAGLASEWGRLVEGDDVTRPLAWFVEHLDAFHSCCDLSDVPGGAFLDHLHLIPERPDISLTIEGSLSNLSAVPTCNYPVAGVCVTPCGDLSEDDADAFPAASLKRAGQFYLRNPIAERAAIDRIEAAGFQPSRGSGSQRGTWNLSGEKAIFEFYGSVLGRLEGIWDVTFGERFESLAQRLVRIAPSADFSDDAGFQTGGDWLTLSVRYLGDAGREIPQQEIQRLLRGGGEGVIRLHGGQKAVLDRAACNDLDEVLKDCDPSQSSGEYKIRRTFADYVSNTITSHNPKVKGWDGAGVLPVSKAEFADGIGGLADQLRDYQLGGAMWIAGRLGAAGGALLADEMGLGKTVQTLALVTFWKNREKEEAPLPSLVVCPKSLLENWRAEAEKFAPGLRSLVIKGAPDTRAELLRKRADLLITSYGTLIQDGALYQDKQFGVVVLDEAGAIKNPKTRAAKAARQLEAEGKLALTGTPVENSVRDLWSIFEFTVPGYLGSLEQFESRYAKPLEEAGKQPQGLMDRLRRRVSPFVLRRTKSEVVSELPQKIEKTVFCELTPAQESVYRQILDSAHADIDEAKRKRGAGAAKLAMFTALLRLRQTCCDLRVLPSGGEINSLSGEEASGKLEAFRNELGTVMDAGGRALCFSQFVSVLDLLRKDLVAQGIGYSYLDGQTEKRGEVVDAFQGATATEKPVFLISLKAGGYGLNLTAANHVILYDPWWNPAVEAQAVDRAHRIGQENVVTCSRFIMRGTVEEKILQLQKRKRDVIDAALEDDQPSMAGLTGDDLEALLD